MASHNGNLDIAKILQQRGADINLPEIGGWSPLHLLEHA
jgi:ankyrin repeat protein